MNRRDVLGAAVVAPVAVAAGKPAGLVSFDDLRAMYSKLKELIYLYNDEQGIPVSAADEYLYKRLIQVQATVDLGMS